MDFGLTEEQQDILKAARDFANGELVEQALEWDLAEETPERVVAAAAKLGFVGITIPEHLGGAGLGLLEECLVIEEFSAVNAGAARAILEPAWGNESLAKVVPSDALDGVADGRRKLGLASLGQFFSVISGVSEDSRGVKELSGRFNLVLGNADVFLVPGIKERERGTYFIPSSTPGLTITRLNSKLGLRAWPGADLELAEIDSSDLLFCSGSNTVARAKQAAAIRLAATAVGVARGAAQMALSHARIRRLFGRTLADFEATQHKFFQAWKGVEAARLLTLKAAFDWDAGRDVELASSAARDQAISLAQEVSDEAVQLYGGYGYFEETHVARFYRDAKMLDLMVDPLSATLKRSWPGLSNIHTWYLA